MEKLGLSLHRTKVERLDDRWSFWSDQLGFFAYGVTREEAGEAFKAALTALINSFDSDDDLLDYLERKGIDYWPPRPKSNEEHFEFALVTSRVSVPAVMMSIPSAPGPAS